jgi:hypothetical protein
MTNAEIIETIKVIVSSPLIAQYKFGITVNSPRRRKNYLGVGFEHYVIIDTHLDAQSALVKEQAVFNTLTKDMGGSSFFIVNITTKHGTEIHRKVLVARNQTLEILMISILPGGINEGNKFVIIQYQRKVLKWI